MEWPVDDKFSEFRSEVEAQLPQQLLLRDISEHPNPDVRKQPGHYEPNNNTVWINHIYRGIERLYVVSHEVAHAWQFANGYPRVHAVYEPSNIHEDNQYLRDLIYKISNLADRISNVVLDLAAYREVSTRDIVQKELLSPTLPKVYTDDFKMFDPNVFDKELSRLPNRIKKNTIMTEPQLLAFWLSYGVGVVTNACALASGILRIKEADRFDRTMIQMYQLYPEPTRRVSDRLNEIVVDNDIISVAGCEKALESILQYLNVPKEIMTLG